MTSSELSTSATIDLKEIINNVNSTKDIKIIIDQLRDLKQSIFQINSDSGSNHLTITSVLKLLIENVLDNWYFAFTEPDKQLFESFFFIPNILLESFITITTIVNEYQTTNNNNNNNSNNMNQLYSQKLSFLFNILYKFINNNYLSKLFIEFINRKLNKNHHNNSNNSNNSNNEVYESIWNLIVNSVCSVPDKSRSIQYYYKNNSRIRGGIHQSPLSNIKEYILEFFSTNSIYFSKIIEQIIISINNITDNSNNQNSIYLLSSQISILFTKMIKTGDKEILIYKFFKDLFKDTKDSKIIQLKRKIQCQIVIGLHGSCLDTFLESFIKSLPNFSKDDFNNIFRNLILDLYSDYQISETSMIFHIIFNKILILKELDNNTQNCLLELLYQLLKVEKIKKSSNSDNGRLKSYEEEQQEEAERMKKENQPIMYTILVNLLKSWKDSYFIRHCTNEHHAYITRSIIYFIQKVNDNGIFKMNESQLDTVKSLVLNGIDLHLKITISNINVRGMFVAEIFSKLFYNSQTENQLKFDYTLDTPDQKCFSTNFIPIFKDINNNSSNNSINSNDNNKSSINNNKNQMDHYKELLQKEFSKYDDPDMAMVQDDDEGEAEEIYTASSSKSNNKEEEKRKAFIEEIDDDDDEVSKNEDSDDDLVPYDLNDDESDLNPNLKKKIYLRDCLLELQSSKHTAESWENSLLSISKIVWSKPDDLDELSEQLAISLLHLTNEYDIDGFSQYRHESLVALATQSPSIVIPYLTHSFKQPNFSIGQRLEILDTISESARELSGNNGSNNSNQKSNSSNNSNNKFEIQQNQPPKLINEIGIVRRWGVSNKISRPVIKRNQFYNYVKLFFYPLLERYDKVTQCYSMDLLGYDSFLLSRLIFTLGIIVECAGNSIDSRQVSKELISFCYSLRNHQDTNVRRSILFSISRVFYSNDSMSKQIIDQDYNDEIEDILSFLYDISQSDSDNDSRIMSLATFSKILNLLKINI